jgi:hypothetical protein
MHLSNFAQILIMLKLNIDVDIESCNPLRVAQLLKKLKTNSSFDLQVDVLVR